MASEMVKKVLKAEEAASLAMQEASSKASDILEKAKKDAVAIVDESKKQAKLTALSISDEATLKSVEIAAASHSRAFKESEQLEKNTLEKKSQAVKAVAESILGV